MRHQARSVKMLGIPKSGDICPPQMLKKAGQCPCLTVGGKGARSVVSLYNAAACPLHLDFVFHSFLHHFPAVIFIFI